MQDCWRSSSSTKSRWSFPARSSPFGSCPTPSSGSALVCLSPPHLLPSLSFFFYGHVTFISSLPPESTDPAKAKVRLSMNTEVIVAPKKRKVPGTRPPKELAPSSVTPALSKRRCLGQFRVLPAEWISTSTVQGVPPTCHVAMLNARFQASLLPGETATIEIKTVPSPSQRKNAAQPPTPGNDQSAADKDPERAQQTILHPRPVSSAPASVSPETNPLLPRDTSVVAGVSFQFLVPEGHIVMDARLRDALGTETFARVRIFTTTRAPEPISPDQEAK